MDVAFDGGAPCIVVQYLDRTRRSTAVRHNIDVGAVGTIIDGVMRNYQCLQDGIERDRYIGDLPGINDKSGLSNLARNSIVPV
jgi:hypothetical protein